MLSHFKLCLIYLQNLLLNRFACHGKYLAVSIVIDPLLEINHGDSIDAYFNYAFILGGTDIISCFMGCNPTLPVYSGEIQCRFLGMAIEARDSEGKNVLDERGELVCVKPFPSMPTHFWNDPNRVKYNKAYFPK